MIMRVLYVTIMFYECDQINWIWGLYYKSKLEMKSNSKFCQVIVSLSVILLQLTLTKLKLEVFKSDF